MRTSTFARARLVGTGIALAGAALLPLPSLAAGDTAPARSAEPAAPSATSGQIVVRDTTSGLLRAPTPEEARALKPTRAPSRTPGPQTLPRYHASGAQGARLTDEFMSYSVLVRQADGRLVEQCFDSKEAADAAVKGSATSTQTTQLPTE